MGVENRFLGLAVAPMTRLDWETAFWRDWNRPAFCRIDWEWVAVRWAAGFWKLQGLTRRRLGMPKLFMARATAPMFSGRDGSTRTTQRLAWKFGIGFGVLFWPKNGRGGEIRTPDLVVPIHARCQTTLRPDWLQRSEDCLKGRGIATKIFWKKRGWLVWVWLAPMVVDGKGA